MFTYRTIETFLNNLWASMYQNDRFINGAPEEAYVVALDGQQELAAVPLQQGAPGAHHVQFTQQQVHQALTAAQLGNALPIGTAHNHPPPANPVIRTQVGSQTVTTCTIANPMPSAGDVQSAARGFVFNIVLSFYEVWIDLRVSAGDRRFFRLTNHGRVNAPGNPTLAFRIAEYQNRISPTSGGGGTALFPSVASLCSLRRHRQTRAADLRFAYAFTFDEQVVSQNQTSHYTTQWWQVVRTAQGVRRSRSRLDNPLTPNGFFPQMESLLRQAAGLGVAAPGGRTRTRPGATARRRSSDRMHPLTRAPLRLAESTLQKSNQKILAKTFLSYDGSPSRSEDEIV